MPEVCSKASHVAVLLSFPNCLASSLVNPCSIAKALSRSIRRRLVTVSVIKLSPQRNMGYSVEPILPFYIKTAAGWGKFTFISKQSRPRLEAGLAAGMLNVRIQFPLFGFCQTFDQPLFFNLIALNFNVLAGSIVPISRSGFVQLLGHHIIPESIHRRGYGGGRAEKQAQVQNRSRWQQNKALLYSSIVSHFTSGL